MTRQEAESPYRRSREKQSDGQSMAEFALTLPILLLLMCGCVDFGRYIYIDGQINSNALKAAQDAANVQNQATDCAVQADATNSAGGYTISMDPNSISGNTWAAGGSGFTITSASSGQGYAYIYPAVAQSPSNCVGTANRGTNTSTGTVDCTGTGQTATTIQKSVIVRITYTFNSITPAINRVIGSPVIEVCSIVPTAY